MVEMEDTVSCFPSEQICVWKITVMWNCAQDQMCLWLAGWDAWQWDWPSERATGGGPALWCHCTGGQEPQQRTPHLSPQYTGLYAVIIRYFNLTRPFPHKLLGAGLRGVLRIFRLQGYFLPAPVACPLVPPPLSTFVPAPSGLYLFPCLSFSPFCLNPPKPIPACNLPLSLPLVNSCILYSAYSLVKW